MAKDICNKAEQLVVLAHDIYFVRDLRDELTRKDVPFLVAVLGLRNSAKGYTNFDKLDVDKECQSPYFHHHGLLVEFVSTTALSFRPSASCDGVRIDSQHSVPFELCSCMAFAGRSVA